MLDGKVFGSRSGCTDLAALGLYALTSSHFPVRTSHSVNKYILRNNTNFYLTVSEWLASPGGTKFSKPIEEMSKEEQCISEEFLHVCEEEEERWHTVS